MVDERETLIVVGAGDAGDELPSPGVDGDVGLVEIPRTRDGVREKRRINGAEMKQKVDPHLPNTEVSDNRVNAFMSLCSRALASEVEGAGPKDIDSSIDDKAIPVGVAMVTIVIPHLPSVPTGHTKT